MPIALLAIYEDTLRVPLTPIVSLYETLVRAKLVYASAVWDTAHNTPAQALESVQKHISSFIRSDYARTFSVLSVKTQVAEKQCSCKKIFPHILQN